MLMCKQAAEAAFQQDSLDLPHLQPGDLQVCIGWLRNRQALLEGEQTALHALPPAANQQERLKVGHLLCVLLLPAQSQLSGTL